MAPEQHEYAIAQRDAVIRELVRECEFLQSLVRGWCFRGVVEARRKAGLKSLGNRLNRRHMRILREASKPLGNPGKLK